MKIYTIIGGVNGVGKSSLTGILQEERKDLGVIIDVDKITTEMGVTAREGGMFAVKKIRECFEQGLSFTQETTLAGVKTVQSCKRAKELGYYVRLFYVGLNSVRESLNRIENRVNKGGHDIPDEDVLRRFTTRWESVAKVLPFCDEANFYDNYNGFIKVAGYRDQQLQIEKDRVCPKWMGELEMYLQQNTTIRVVHPGLDEQTKKAKSKSAKKEDSKPRKKFEQSIED